MGSRAIIYYFATTMLAAILGIFLVLVIHPGDPTIKEQTGGGKFVCTCNPLAYCISERNASPPHLITSIR